MAKPESHLTLKVVQKDRFTLLDATTNPSRGNRSRPPSGRIRKAHRSRPGSFLTIDIARNLTLQQLHEFFSLIQTLDRDTGIRVEAPPPGSSTTRFSPRSNGASHQALGARGTARQGRQRTAR